MYLNLTIMLVEGETLAQTAKEIADAIIDVLGGDPDTDSCSVAIQQEPQQGTSGPVPEPPVLPVPAPE